MKTNLAAEKLLKSLPSKRAGAAPAPPSHLPNGLRKLQPAKSVSAV